MQRNPQVHVLIVGSDEVCYGNRRGDGKHGGSGRLKNLIMIQIEFTFVHLYHTWNMLRFYNQAGYIFTGQYHSS